MNASRKICMFCGKTAAGQQRAKEHIFPQHLIRKLPILQSGLEHSPFRTVAGDFSGGHITVAPAERKLAYTSFLAGNVCKDCNNGWMSGLEGDVIPFTYALAHGRKSLAAISDSEKSALAMWALKTAIVLSTSVGSPLFKTPREHAEALFLSRDQLPEGVAVFGHVASTHRALWSLCPTWMVEADGDSGPSGFEEDYKAAYKVFLQVGNLMLLVCWWPTDQFAFTKEHWIAPALATSAVVEPLRFDGRSVFNDESEAFMVGIGVSLA